MESMEREFSLIVRVLLVDDNPVCSKIITRMLKLCNYEVKGVAKATEALETLRNNPKGFDMVITDTCNDIDVLSLIVKIMKIQNIPVILVSGLEDTSTLIKGVLQGADEVLSKPVSFAQVKTLWQHVYRRRLQHQQLNELDPGPTSSSKNEEDQKAESSEAEGESWEGGESERKRKKARVRWQGNLQEKFLQAVVQLGGPVKATPKQIMQIMNVPDVPRESVASHLQKYRNQKKPLVVDQNNTNAVVSSASPSSAAAYHHLHHHHHNMFPLMSHSCHRTINNSNKSMTPPRFGHHHHHHQRHSGFQYGPIGPKLINRHNCITRSSNICSSSHSGASSSWPVPRPDTGFGLMPDQQLPILPPLPASVPPQPSAVAIPITSTGGYSTGFSNIDSNSNNLLQLPSQSPAVPQPAASMATENITNENNSFLFSGEPWMDSGALDDTFFSAYEHEMLDFSHIMG